MRFTYMTLLTLLIVVTSGCLATGVSSVDADPEFNWDALKRDEILMSPLVDLRPGGGEAFFDDKDRLAYSEKFKQDFFRLRKDIRIYGAGGAFENLAKVPNLSTLARLVVDKKPLPGADVAILKAGSQEIRFVFFFAVTDERLTHDYTYEFRSNQQDDVAHYISRRALTVKLALWDSTVNKTVWVATKVLGSQDVTSVAIPNPTKRRKKQGQHYIWVGTSLASNLTRELREHPGLFPGYPGREPAFTKSFADFVLALPIQPSEAKLIEYEHFTYHRPEAGLSTSKIGSAPTVGLFLGTSSVINYHYRVGAGFLVPLNTPTFDDQGVDTDVSMLAYGVSFDYEAELHTKLRLLTGVFTGGAAFTMRPTDAPEPAADEPEADDGSTTDGALVFWPRLRLLFGEKAGLQWGLGGTYRLFDGIEEPFLKAHSPAAWSFELNLGYAFRGF